MALLPAAALANHTAVLGKTGSGKTSTAKLIVEHVVSGGVIGPDVEPKARVCILDPIKSDWWGVTSSADGKSPGLPFHVLGGPRAHVPVHEAAGAAIGELVARGELPLSIVDMALFPPGGQSQFFVSFAETLLKRMRGVLYLVLEEAHVFAPKDRAGFGQENMAIHWAKTLATAGRSRGVRLILVTQRTQALHNALLGSCETMLAHRLTAPADQKPVIDWLKANAPTDIRRAVESSMSSLRTGTAWLCCGEAKTFERREFPRIATFDNTATPTDSDDASDVATVQVDRERLRGLIGTAVAEAEANDPKKLKDEIKRLKAELAHQPAGGATPDQLTAAREEGRRSGRNEGFSEGCAKAWSVASQDLAQLDELAQRIAAVRRRWADKQPETLAALIAAEPVATPPVVADPLVQSTPATQRLRSPVPAPTVSAAGAPGLKPALQRVVNAIGWWRQIGFDPVDRNRACVVAGYSPNASTFGVYVAELVKLGYVEAVPGKVALTPQGIASAVVPPGETHDQIRMAIKGLLKPQEWRVFEVVYAAYPNDISRPGIARALGLSPTASTAGVYIAAVASFGVIETTRPGHLGAAAWLFP